MSEYPNVEQCGSCHRTLNPPLRCPCTYEQPTPTAALPWLVVPTSLSVGVLFSSEMFARAYA